MTFGSLRQTMVENMRSRSATSLAMRSSLVDWRARCLDAALAWYTDTRGRKGLFQIHGLGQCSLNQMHGQMRFIPC